MERTVIHLNITDFAVAVETNLQPALAGYPLIIAPLGAPRAVVYDMSETAFQQGIRKGMPLARAKRLNKKIKILPPDFKRYEKVMTSLFKESCAFTPLIESGNLDGHIYLDVTGVSRLFGPSVDVAFKLKKTFKKAFNLDPIWSVAPNKLVAKVATRVVKPFGEYIVAPGEEAAFLAPLPIHLIPGLAKNDLKKLYEFNLAEVSQVRALSLDQLEIPFDHRAPQIYEYIRGIDIEPVASVQSSSARSTPSPIQADHAFENDTNNIDQLKKGLYLACEKICYSLRGQKHAGAKASMTLSYSDGRQSRAKSKLARPTSNDITLFKQTLDLLNKAWTRRVRIRHLRLEIKQLCPESIQSQLFAPRTKEIRQTGLIRTMDHIRKKFGQRSISTALTLTQTNVQP
jgi:DNA polymerase-4